MADTGRLRDDHYTQPVPKLWEEIPAIDSAFATSFGMGFGTQGLTSRFLRAHAGQSELGVRTVLNKLRGIEEEYIQPDVANSLGQEYGLSYTEPVRSIRFEYDLEDAKNQKIRQSILSRLPQDFSNQSAMFMGGLAASIVDPIEAAVSVMPVIGAARKAALISKFGATTGRVAAGVAEGVAGAALAEYPRYALLQQAQLDYEVNDLIANIAFGGIMGGGLHYVAGRISDKYNLHDMPTSDLNIPERIEKSSIETKYNALRVGLSDFMEGRKIDVEPVLRLDPEYTKEYRGFNRIGKAEWNVPDFTPENQRRIDAKIDREISIAFESRFDTRSDADKYIRSNAKETQSSRMDYLIQKSDDGKIDVYKIRDTQVIQNEDGTPTIFKRKGDAEKYANDENAKIPPDSGEKYHAVKMKSEESGRAGQQFIVIKGKNLTDADIEKIKNTPAFFRPEYENIQTNVVKEALPKDINRIIHDMVNSRSSPQSKVSVLDIEKTPEPKKYPDNISELDVYNIETLEDFNFLLKNIKKETGEDVTLAMKDELDEIKLFEDDLRDFESKKENFMALAECMSR